MFRVQQMFDGVKDKDVGKVCRHALFKFKPPVKEMYVRQTTTMIPTVTMAKLYIGFLFMTVRPSSPPL